jgi:SNF2 family DNA or RNA helicase
MEVDEHPTIARTTAKIRILMVFSAWEYVENRTESTSLAQKAQTSKQESFCRCIHTVMPPSDPKARAEALAKAHEQLKKVRASKTVALKPIARLKDTIIGFDGKPQPFKLRYYQVQGAYHLMLMKRLVLGDGTGLGKTVEAVAALAYLWEKEPNNKVIVVAPKSAIRQWASEIKRFTNGVKPILATGTAEERKEAYAAFLNAPTGPNDPKVVLILNYAILIRDWNLDGFQPPALPNGRPDPKKPVVPGILDRVTTQIGSDLVVIYDEATAFKNMRTKTWEVARFLGDKAGRCYGLTATLLKNNLMEGYCIYKAIKPDLFGTKTKFYDDYCFIEMKQVARARIPIILGYKNLDRFRETIDPFFLGRPRHAVSDELPTLTTREITFEITKAENAKYHEALEGLLELGDGTVKDFEENKALVSLIYCQQIVNSLTQLKFKEGDEILDDFILDETDTHKVGSLSSKEQALVDLLVDELDGEKTIVYTRFASLVPRLQDILKKNGIKSTRITGKENDKTRAKNQAAFQDMGSDTQVIFVTAAGTEAINLQAAAAMIFFDAPWSWGDYVQALGRMIRIGSPHPAVVAYHLMAERGGEDRKTIDHHVLKLLRKKKGLIDKVLGESAVGALKFEKEEKGSVLDLLRAMQGKSKE